jgi:hypothetical protein
LYLGDALFKTSPDYQQSFGIVFPLPLQADGLIVPNLGFCAMFALLAINFWVDGPK